MTTFDRREEAFESRFAHDEEMTFKAHARRNLKLGLWAAALLGKTGSEAQAYADALVSTEVDAGSGDAIVHKLQADFAAANVTRSEHQIRREMDRFLVEAQAEVRAS